MNKSEAINKVIAFAEKQVGYKETGTNITKYSKFFDDLRKQNVDVYNFPKQGASWCDIFYDYLFVQCFGVTDGLKMIYQPMESCGAGCRFSASYYRKHNAWHITDPEPGDQIFFGSKGAERHTGIVIRVTGATVYTIEGNKDNQVKKCSYRISNRDIAGYGRPDWSVVEGENGDAKDNDPKPVPAIPAEKPSAKETKFIVTAKHGLNLRKGAGVGFAKIACMPKGTVFVSSKQNGNWAFGKYGKHEGWSCMDWLRKQ